MSTGKRGAFPRTLRLRLRSSAFSFLGSQFATRLFVGLGEAVEGVFLEWAADEL